MMTMITFQHRMVCECGEGQAGGFHLTLRVPIIGCKPFHQEAGTQGDFRQEGRGLWSADPGRLRLLSSG